MMTLEDTGQAVHFLKGDSLAGSYVYSDPFKPYLHPLNTPSGQTLSLCSPHDHKHHKGLMYALQTKTTNFWEEVSKSPDVSVGVQKHQRFNKVIAEGDAVGFHEVLHWYVQNSKDTLFEEMRTILCRFDPQDVAYKWTWEAQLTALQPNEIVMSQWSHVAPDQRRVNYHGLGLRFRQDFDGTEASKLTVDGSAMIFQNAMGLKPKTVTFSGRIDSTFPAQEVSVTFSQEQAGGLFVMQSPFAFMSLGPSNLSPFTLGKGETIDEHYNLCIVDRQYP